MEIKDATSHDEQPSIFEESKLHVLEGGSAATTSHLYQEDSNGKVLDRLLLPRPTDDPNDPLTWSPRRKTTAVTSVCFFVFLSNYITLSISPILISVIAEFDVSLDKGSYLVTFNLLFLGLGNLFWVPLSEKIGKRPVLLMCSGLFFVSSIWAAVAKSWGSLFGARIVQGFAASSCEALGLAVVADLFFLHERGLWVGFYSLMFTVGSALGGVFAGLVASATPNWRWVFWKNVILTGFLFLTVIVFQAETNFKRPVENESGEGLPSSALAAIRARADVRWVDSLSVTRGYDRNVSILWLWWRPWLTLQYPAVVWCSLVYGVCLGWLILQINTNSSAFPQLYSFSPQAVGNINLSYLVAALVGSAAGGPFSDWIIKFITRRHGGFFVPEYRLWCLIPPSIVAPVGLMLWGCGLEDRLNHMVPIVGTAITYGVLCAVPAVAMTYVVDSYRALAGETMTVLTAFKNTFAFGLSFAVFPWIAKDGFLKVSGYNLLIEGLLFSTTIPLYIYGARIRQWTNNFKI